MNNSFHHKRIFLILVIKWERRKIFKGKKKSLSQQLPRHIKKKKVKFSKSSASSCNPLWRVQLTSPQIIWKENPHQNPPHFFQYRYVSPCFTHEPITHWDSKQVSFIRCTFFFLLGLSVDAVLASNDTNSMHICEH